MELVGPWGAQLFKHLTLAQAVISQLVSLSSSRKSGSVLTAQSLEPASDSVSLSLSAPLPHSCSISLCLLKINKQLLLFFNGVGIPGEGGGIKRLLKISVTFLKKKP